jgi:cytochrome b pre-mRNA-processing protein 3
MLGRLFQKSPVQANARALFAVVNAQSRNPELYGPGRVPDTPDGRFELMALFAFGLFRRLSGKGPLAEATSQAVFDMVFKTFDQALRDLGVGDTQVGKRIRRLAESFYGRLAAYADALDSHDATALAQAVARNVLGRERQASGFEDALAARLSAWIEALAALPDTQVVAGANLPDA